MPKRASWVWKYADKSDDGKDVTCKICKAVLCYNGSPSSITNHLKKIHNEKPDISMEESTEESVGSEVENSMEVPSTSTSTSRKRRRRNNGEDHCSADRQEIISQSITRLIGTTLLPISLVSSEGFREFMHILEPGYKVPCAQTIRTRLQFLHDKIKKKLSSDLSKVNGVSLSIDEWSSRTQNSYMSVEAQYLDEECQMHRVTLCNLLLEGRATANNISETVQSVMKEWNLESKILAVVHDSASAMIAAGNLMNIPHSLKCNAHLLQLCVKDALKDVSAYEKVCTKGSAITTHFHKSNIASQALTQRQIQLNQKKK